MRRATSTTFACAAATTAIALAAFAPLSLGGHWSAVRDGGVGMFVLVVFALLAPALTAWLAVRRASITGVALAVVAPVVGGALASDWAGRPLDAAVAGRIGDVVPRVVSELYAEAGWPRVLGALVGASCAVTGMIGLAARASGSSRSRSRRTVALGAAWLVASLALLGLSIWLREREVVGLSALVPAVVIASIAAALELERGGGAHAIFCGALGVIGVCLFERAIALRVDVEALSAQAGDSVDFTQRVKILATMVTAEKIQLASIAVHVLLGGVTFMSVAASNARERRDVLTGGFVAVALVGVAVYERAVFRRFLEVARRAFDTDVPLTVPTSPPRWGISGDDRRILVTRDAVVRVERPVANEGIERPDRNVTDVLADAALSCGALVDALARQPARRLALQADVHSPQARGVEALGDLSVLAGGRRLEGFRVDFEPRRADVDAEISGDAVVVRYEAISATVALGATQDDAIRVLQPITTRSRLYGRDYVNVTVRRDETVQTLVTALALVDAAFHVDEKHGRHYAIVVK
jgi:hypothetical protein